mmetsp:Transcript_9031/g.21732  ORF Transcript_9031/g.21732 Transcript_9031/m.21732 type:complete len:256 (-) Transcript_9031:453-1220(-)
MPLARGARHGSPSPRRAGRTPGGTGTGADRQGRAQEPRHRPRARGPAGTNRRSAPTRDGSAPWLGCCGAAAATTGPSGSRLKCPRAPARLPPSASSCASQAAAPRRAARRPSGQRGASAGSPGPRTRRARPGSAARTTPGRVRLRPGHAQGPPTRSPRGFRGWLRAPSGLIHREAAPRPARMPPQAGIGGAVGSPPSPLPRLARGGRATVAPGSRSRSLRRALTRGGCGCTPAPRRQETRRGAPTRGAHAAASSR